MLRERFRGREPSQIDVEIDNARLLVKRLSEDWFLLPEELRKRRHAEDHYFIQSLTFLETARSCGLDSQAIIDSCFDMAATFTLTPEIRYDHARKSERWWEARNDALSHERKPRRIDMELDPQFFEAILNGTKTHEGRAYKTDTDKDYPDIRYGDRICFTISDRQPEFADELPQRGLRADNVMVCTVRDVHFAPTVHHMYRSFQFTGHMGDSFQPMIGGNHIGAALQRAAVYHAFPGYHELIDENGFLGIELENPVLLA